MVVTRAEDLVKCVKGRWKKPRVVVVASEDRNAIEAVYHAWKEGLIEATLVGSKEKITRVAHEACVDVEPFEMLNRPDEKGCIAEALELIKEGAGDILMKGRVATQDLIRKVLERHYGLRTERILSHVAVFTSPREERIIILTDAGINISPDITRKRDIILNAVDVAKVIGIFCPRVAILAFVEKAQYRAIQSTIDAAILRDMNRSGNIPGCIVEGPYALDNAVCQEAARIKNIQGEVAGRADILVAHDINMGNAIYKALQIWVGTVIAGVVVGSRIPIVVSSRVDSMESKLQSIALGILLMQSREKI